MAIIFEMWVETGESKEDAINIQNYFKEVGIIKTELGEYPIRTYHATLKGSMITVEGIPTRGQYSKEIAIELTLIGFQYYRHLKDAPVFRFALVGYDVDGAYELEDFIKDPTDLIDVPGIVIRKDLYEIIGSPGNLVEFRPDYVWTPYEGMR